MADRLRIAIAGLGRMGQVHAANLAELSEEGVCELVAVVDSNPERWNRAPGGLAKFTSIDELAASGICNATMVVTPTDKHREHAATLLRAGHRVLLEKPLTGTLAGDREFAAELDRDYPTGVMIAFQRRFDAALQYARQLAVEGAVGRVFKIYSALEDSGPAPNGYQSDGILPDMAVHNVDEILWILGRQPTRALAVGSRLYSHRLTTCVEDFDDAMLFLWFGTDTLAQVQVSRNHVSGYRVETTIYGEEGQIQIGRFVQKPDEVVVQAFGRRLSAAPIAHRVFPGEPDRADAPEFVARFRSAYKAEVVEFIECCRTGRPFPVTHTDAVNAQLAISKGMEKMLVG